MLTKKYYVGFEVFTAVTMENALFWDVTPCGFVRADVLPKRRLLQEQHSEHPRRRHSFKKYYACLLGS
jgi:hypothetical protein